MKSDRPCYDWSHRQSPNTGDGFLPEYSICEISLWFSNGIHHRNYHVHLSTNYIYILNKHTSHSPLRFHTTTTGWAQPEFLWLDMSGRQNSMQLGRSMGHRYRFARNKNDNFIIFNIIYIYDWIKYNIIQYSKIHNNLI